MDMRPRILVTREVFDETLAYLEEHCEVEANQGDKPFDPVNLAERLKDKDGVVCCLTDRVDGALLDGALLARLTEIVERVGVPVLVGPSRKSFIGKVTGAPVEQRLAGTLAAVAASVLAGATFLRVEFTLVLAALWTIPAGVVIGLNPRLSAVMQPIAQIAASVPAPALFPIVLLLLIRIGGGLGIASIVLLMLGTQWYILFNVIAGAMAIPTDLKEAAQIFRFDAFERWRHLILPGIFPYLVTGMVTASGGAWNASIVAEYFHFQGRIVKAPGLGSTISSASDAGHFNVLLASTLIMAALVVLINRMVWRRLYRLASTRFKLEG
jgi:ABC-type anion transport system duplicated permease subunit